MYKVITVDSKFSKGQFIQVLNLVRQWNQDRFDYTVAKKENSKQERAESGDGYDPTNDAENISTTNDTANLDVASATVQDEVAADSLPEQDVADLGEFENDLASRKEFQDLQNAFPDTGPFDGIPADGSVLDQQNSVNNLFGQNR